MGAGVGNTTDAGVTFGYSMDTKPMKSEDAMTTLDIGRLVIDQEIKGLEALRHHLNDTFTAAVTVLSQVKGHVITTGMGKSGIIARKIAATLASTGTPAFFIHPAEASHGDLGLITKDSALLVLSNSGNTKELHDILEYTRRLSLPLIALTRREGSVLTELATVEIVIPNIPEACPNGLAPTTSTTMMVALGDALAVALLKLRKFTPQDYLQFHPGGTLGRNLLRVEEFMHGGDALPLVYEQAKLQEVLRVMNEKKFGCVGVVNQHGVLVGIITDGDLRRHLTGNVGVLEEAVARSDDDAASPPITAALLMTENPKVIRAKALLVEAVAKMSQHAITSFFIVNEDHHPQGLLHIHDCLKAGFR